MYTEEINKSRILRLIAWKNETDELRAERKSGMISLNCTLYASSTEQVVSCPGTNLAVRIRKNWEKKTLRC